MSKFEYLTNFGIFLKKMGIIQLYSRLVKFEHTVFALPFAFTGFFMALEQETAEFNLRLLFLVLLCMVFARNAAMAFNRYLDRKFDGLNPRTALREIPAGLLKPGPVLWFVVLNAVFFITTTWFINTLCFYLSPVALFVILFYSYTKRFTPLCHFVLSLGLAIAPVGAYLAVAGQFSLVPVMLGIAVFFWVSGFDIIYALQDIEFDRQTRLRSVPEFLGRHRALKVARLVHLFSLSAIIAVALLIPGNFLHWAGSLIFGLLLFYQHTVVKADDLRRVNLAFFTMNGIASVVYGGLMIAGYLISPPFWF